MNSFAVMTSNRAADCRYVSKIGPTSTPRSVFVSHFAKREATSGIWFVQNSRGGGWLFDNHSATTPINRPAPAKEVSSQLSIAIQDRARMAPPTDGRLSGDSPTLPGRKCRPRTSTMPFTHVVGAMLPALRNPDSLTRSRVIAPVASSIAEQGQRDYPATSRTCRLSHGFPPEAHCPRTSPIE